MPFTDLMQEMTRRCPGADGWPAARAVAALLCLGLVVVRAAAAEPSPAWHVGGALEKQLAEHVGVHWQGKPLRPAIEDLSEMKQIAVLIDRRVDPGQTLDLSIADAPLKAVFRRIAADCGLELSMLGPVVYFGPFRVGSELRTLARLRRDELREMPPEVARKFSRAEPIRWDDFTTPGDLLSRLADDNEMDILGLDHVPHDLWAAADLPALSLIDRLTLIVGQFDLTFQIAADGGAVTLVEIPDEVALVRGYPGGNRPTEVAQRWEALVPLAQVRVVGDKIYVKGTLDDHDRIAASRRPTQPPSSGPGEGPAADARYTANVVNQPLGEVLDYFADGLKLELRIDRSALKTAGVSLETLVSFSVEDATCDELFEAFLTPAGCTFQREGNILEVGPARRE